MIDALGMSLESRLELLRAKVLQRRVHNATNHVDTGQLHALTMYRNNT